jgi:hypothetical protein
MPALQRLLPVSALDFRIGDWLEAVGPIVGQEPLSNVGMSGMRDISRRSDRLLG